MTFTLYYGLNHTLLTIGTDRQLPICIHVCEHAFHWTRTTQYCMVLIRMYQKYLHIVFILSITDPTLLFLAFTKQSTQNTDKWSSRPKHIEPKIIPKRTSGSVRIPQCLPHVDCKAQLRKSNSYYYYYSWPQNRLTAPSGSRPHSKHHLSRKLRIKITNG